MTLANQIFPSGLGISSILPMMWLKHPDTWFLLQRSRENTETQFYMSSAYVHVVFSSRDISSSCYVYIRTFIYKDSLVPGRSLVPLAGEKMWSGYETNIKSACSSTVSLVDQSVCMYRDQYSVETHRALSPAFYRLPRFSSCNRKALEVYRNEANYYVETHH